MTDARQSDRATSDCMAKQHGVLKVTVLSIRGSLEIENFPSEAKDPQFYFTCEVEDHVESRSCKHAEWNETFSVEVFKGEDTLKFTVWAKDPKSPGSPDNSGDLLVGRTVMTSRVLSLLQLQPEEHNRVSSLEIDLPLSGIRSEKIAVLSIRASFEVHEKDAETEIQGVYTSEGSYPLPESSRGSAACATEYSAMHPRDCSCEVARLVTERITERIQEYLEAHAAGLQQKIVSALNQSEKRLLTAIRELAVDDEPDGMGTLKNNRRMSGKFDTDSIGTASMSSNRPIKAKLEFDAFASAGSNKSMFSVKENGHYSKGNRPGDAKSKKKSLMDMDSLQAMNILRAEGLVSPPPPDKISSAPEQGASFGRRHSWSGIPIGNGHASVSPNPLGSDTGSLSQCLDISAGKQKSECSTKPVTPNQTHLDQTDHWAPKLSIRDSRSSAGSGKSLPGMGLPVSVIPQRSDRSSFSLARKSSRHQMTASTSMKEMRVGYEAELLGWEVQNIEEFSDGTDMDGMSDSWLPRVLMSICGITPMCSCMSGVYFCCLLVLVVAASALSTKLVVDEAGSLYTGFAPMSLSVGVCLGLASIRRTNAIQPLLGLLSQYAVKENFHDDWMTTSKRQLRLLFAAWLSSLCLYSLLPLTGHFLNCPDEAGVYGSADSADWQANLVSVLAFAYASGLFVMLLYCQVHIIRFLRLMLDSFCRRLFEAEALEELVSEWNARQAILRHSARMIEDCFIVTQTCALISMVLSVVSVWSDANRYCRSEWLMLALEHTPALILGLVTLVLFGDAASVSEHCVRVPALVNSIQTEGPVDNIRQYVVIYILNSDAGFYVRDVRLTTAMALKITYLVAAACVGLLMQALHA